ncbi:hypothetical protein [Variovorax sp. PAMC 28711]|uniref:hypothetical protein n=1 Tax=Variovorax sp. PAMC 28711 TaxID=1795631 RepID=UPI00078C4F41|nr:hypothetical protein [Variovorax sp. PAMC 28711]AMM23541.1 hypothetical protein AX767_03630 [Variovorax sp. PAMC 28711]
MKPQTQTRGSTTAAVVFDLLNPIPFGFFVAALIFDVIYARSADLMWVKSAAWLISIGLSIAVIPRLINLAWVWFPGARHSTARSKAAFFLYLVAVVTAIVNALVHSRDAYAAMPQGLWLSVLTVGLLVVVHVLVTLQQVNDVNKVPA